MTSGLHDSNSAYELAIVAQQLAKSLMIHDFFLWLMEKGYLKPQATE